MARKSTKKVAKKEAKKEAKKAAKKAAKKVSLPVVRLNYIKCNSFRTVHVDGAFGGTTPLGNIQMSVYSERFPIPRESSQYINLDGTLGDELKEQRVSRSGVIREIEVNLVMDLDRARSIVTWLQGRIKEVEEVRRATELKALIEVDPSKPKTKKKASKKKASKKKVSKKKTKR